MKPRQGAALSSDPGATLKHYRAVRLYLVLALALLAGTALYVIAGQRQQIWGSARANLENLALGFRNSSSLALEHPAFTLRAIAADLAFNSAPSREVLLGRLREAMRGDSASAYLGVATPGAGGVMLVDRTGQAASPEVASAVEALLQPGTSGGLELHQLIRLPHGSDWYLPVALGVAPGRGPAVFALVPARRLIEGTQSMRLVRDGWVTLLTLDGTRLLSYSPSRNELQVNGPRVPTSIMRLHSADSGSLEALVPEDNVRYLVGYARSATPPLNISAVVPVSALYATWLEQALTPLVLLLVGVLAVVIFWMQLQAALTRQMAYVTHQAYLMGERERAEVALRDSHELLQTIIDNSPALVYVKDLEGRYLLVNRRFEESSQLKREVLLGRTDHDVFPKQAADTYRAVDREVIASDSVVTQEQLLNEAEGPRDYINVKAPLRDAAGRVRGVFGISTDITDRKRAELALSQLHSALQQAYDDLRQSQEAVVRQERLRALGQMAAGIAHDINNALAPAYLYAQSLAESEHVLDEEARAELAIVQRAIEDVARTVSRMEEFSRPRHLDTLTSLDLNALLKQAAELTRVRWSGMPQEHGAVIQLQMELDPALPPVLGAQNEIRDAITNLILNAVDAMPEGGLLRLRSRTLRDSADGADGSDTPSRVCVEVGDTGAGMDAEVRARCLEPFFTTKGERGMGLGLAMVYGMVQRHGGELQIESAPGHGTTVRLIFTAAIAKEGPRALPAAPQVPPLHLLVIDDDPMLLESLKRILESDGHRVAVARGGEAGVEAFGAAAEHGEDFDAVITDLGMPKVDGRSVAAAIKLRSPGTPVMLLTGWDQRLRMQDAIPEHVDRVLGKPPRLNELRSALAELTMPRTASVQSAGI